MQRRLSRHRWAKRLQATATPSTLLTIRRMDFLSAVLGSCESADVVEQIVSSRISASTEQLAAVP
jgi:hypothetical protein